MPDTHNRSLLRLSGADADDFLQGLITNDIAKAHSGLLYAAILTPQGKYLADFFVFKDRPGALARRQQVLSLIHAIPRLVGALMMGGSAMLQLIGTH